MKDIYVLGINVSHDIAAALVKNGQLVCAIAEERLNRIKRYTGGIDHEGMTNKHLPKRAIQYCLDAAGISLEHVDLITVSSCVVVNYETYQIRSLTKKEVLEQFPSKVDPQKVHIVGHHLGHAASVFYPSDFDEAAVVIVDGGGNLVKKNSGTNELYEERVTIYHGHGDHIDMVKQYLDGSPSDGYLSNKKHCSLGDFYQSATVFVGFHGGDEGKTMGLAPYGTDKYFKDFIDAIEMTNGTLTIRDNFQFNKWQDKKDDCYGGHYGSLRTDGQLRQVDKDIASAAQYALEEVLVKIANEAYALTKSKNLCLAGGVALNSVANKIILDCTPFENISIQPASGDDGCALGNALLGWTQMLGKPRTWKMRTAYTGRSYSTEEINRAVEKYRLWCEPVPVENVVKEASRLLSEKNIIGWFQEGAEFGPRALGHRSILCDTRFPEMKDVLNKRVKHREGFRPFAPSILEEFNSEYFELDCPSPFMLLIAKVKKADAVPAITHADQTARVQTVNKEDNGIYYDLIKEYHNLTGVPVILNTSFNVAGEPIVETPEDAIHCFLSTNIDYLVLGNVLLKKYRVRCKVLRIWPQDIKRHLHKWKKNIAIRYPFLVRIKKIIEKKFKKAQYVNVKVPG